jgi:hypothetical protein
VPPGVLDVRIADHWGVSADLSAFSAAVGDPGERDETAATWQRSDRVALAQQAWVTGDSQRSKAASMVGPSRAHSRIAIRRICVVLADNQPRFPQWESAPTCQHQWLPNCRS